MAKLSLEALLKITDLGRWNVGKVTLVSVSSMGWMSLAASRRFIFECLR